MPTIKLARRTAAAIEPSAKPTTYFDADLKGFGLRVMPSGARSWIVEYRPGAGGRGVAKRRLKLGGAELSPEQARLAAEKALASVSLGGDPAEARAEERATQSVKEMMAAFMTRHVEAKRKDSSAEFYQRAIDLHIVPAIGGKRATHVSRADVSIMHEAIAAKKLADPRAGGRFVANRAVATLSAGYGWASGQGIVPDGFNPAAKVERYDEVGRDRFLTSEEVGRIGEALREAETVGLPYEVDLTKPNAKNAPKPENRRTKFSRHVTGAIRLLMLSGCRLREILHLEWSQIDFERGIAFLPDSKTGKKAVVLSGPAIIVLGNLERVGKFVIASDSAGTPDEVPRADIKRPWAAVCKRAGLFGIRLHDLRHTFASFGAGGGLGLPMIGSLLGHASSATTARYAHLATDPVRAAADMIAGKIGSALDG